MQYFIRNVKLSKMLFAALCSSSYIPMEAYCGDFTKATFNERYRTESDHPQLTPNRCNTSVRTQSGMMLFAGMHSTWFDSFYVLVRWRLYRRSVTESSQQSTPTNGHRFTALARSSLTVTLSSTNWCRCCLTSVNAPMSWPWSPPWA